MANSMPRDEMNPSNAPIDPSGERVDSARADARMPGDEMNPVLNQPAKTGRFLVVFSEGATEEGIKVLSNKAGIKVSKANESDESDRDRVYHALGVAVISPDPDRVSAIASASAERNSPILTMEEEQIARVEPIIGVQETEEDAAWGLIATQVTKSPYSGRGIKIAILDTGLDLKHPDFADRKIISQSFIEGQAVQDGHGHGTHTTGTACGPHEPSNFERYGVAWEADIYVGKVLKNDGSGSDGSIINGINWAIANGCQIISMSIGGLVSVGSSFSYTYEVVA
ncbi:MAG: S8 family serine peptidase, partial [Spirulina sp.]